MKVELLTHTPGALELLIFTKGTRLQASQTFRSLIDDGMAPQDARNLLGTGVLTSIIAKFNLRTLHEMAGTRLCTRTQGEYQDVFRAMKAAVVAVHPWAEPFIRVACAQNGICIFPRYKACPIQKFTLNAAPDYSQRVDAVRRAEPLKRFAMRQRPLRKAGGRCDHEDPQR